MVIAVKRPRQESFQGHKEWLVIPQEVVQALYSSCKSGNFELAEKEVNNVIVEGYLVPQMISQFDLIVGLEDVSDEQRARLLKKMGEADKATHADFKKAKDKVMQIFNVL